MYADDDQSVRELRDPGPDGVRQPGRPEQGLCRVPWQRAQHGQVPTK